MKNSTKVLFIRLDRIGDLILSLPVDEQEGWNSENTAWLVGKGMDFIMNSSQPKREYLTIERDFSWPLFFNLVRWIRAMSPKKSVVFHAPWWIGLALFIARVPVRVGRKSQWHSFLFFNRGLRQKRSRSEKHEYGYNLDLVKLITDNRELNQTHLKLTTNSSGVLKRFNLEEQNFYIVHPGMNGSALNWPVDNYVHLILELAKTDKVVLTGTASDRPYINPIKEKLPSDPNINWLNEKLSGQELIELVSEAKCVIAPSTGVAHIAASTGVKTIGLYSNVIPESAKRWGPRGPNVVTLSPTSAHTPLKDPNVMTEITVHDVLKSI